jgi:hypothetical protein
MVVQKFEIRISKSETNPKFKFSNVQNRIVSNFGLGTFEFVSNLGFRALDFIIKKGAGHRKTLS